MTTKKKSKICSECGKGSFVFHRNRCLRCHERDLTARRLDEVALSFKPKNDYNKQLMDLFLTYVRKCNLRSGYAMQAESLQKILEARAISTILSWEDIAKLSEKHQIWDLPNRKTGCAFKKIGRMLQALGVIGHSEMEGSNQKYFKKLMSEISIENKEWTSSIVAMLQKRKRSLRTQVVWLREIRNLEVWLLNRQNTSRLDCITLEAARDYLDFKKQSSSGHQLYNNFCLLKKIYRWGQREGLVLVNPFESIHVTKPEVRIRHCSDGDMKKLFDFVKNENSDSESALIIVLILFFGLSCEQLLHCQILMNQDGTFSLALKDKPRTYIKRHKRDGMLQLPKEPEWLLLLQRRYARMWKERYEKINKLYDSRPFLLPHNNWYAIALNSRILGKRIKKATSFALGGRSVPYTILRNTCGIIHTHSDDASVLSKLGWSEKHVFKYIFRQREIYIPK